MADLQTILAKTYVLQMEMESLLKAASFEDDESLSCLQVDSASSNQLFLLDELQEIFAKLSEASYRIAYLRYPIKETSCLCKNQRGRYEMASGHEFTCGDSIEVLMDDGHHEHLYWTRTRVEHNGEDYYLVGYRNTSIDDLLARRR